MNETFIRGRNTCSDEAQKVGSFRRKIYRFVEKNVTRKFDGLNKRQGTITYVSFSLIHGFQIIVNLAERERSHLGALTSDGITSQRNINVE